MTRTLLRMLGLLVVVVAAVGAEPDTCFSRQHQGAMVNVRLALNRTGGAMEARVVRLEQDCVLACCSRQVIPGAMCNMAVFNGNKSGGEDNCFLFHCPREQDCPLRAQPGVHTYDIYKGVLHPAAGRPVATTTTTAPPATTNTPTTTPSLTATPTKRMTKTSKKQNKTSRKGKYHVTVHNTTTASMMASEEALATTLTPPTTTSTTLSPTSSTNSLTPPTTTTTTLAPATAPCTTPMAPPTTTTSAMAPPTITTSTMAPPTTITTSTMAPPTTITTSTMAPPTTTTLTMASPTTTTSTMASPTTTTSTMAPPTTTTSTMAPPTTVSITAEVPPATSDLTTVAPRTTPSHTTLAPPAATSTASAGRASQGVVIVPHGDDLSDPAPQNRGISRGKAAPAATAGGALRSGMVAFMVLGIAALTAAVGGRKAMESFDRRHYTRLELNDLHYDV